MSTQLTGASAKILFESPAQLNLKKKLLKEGNFEIVSSGPESATNLDKGITVVRTKQLVGNDAITDAPIYEYKEFPITHPRENIADVFRRRLPRDAKGSLTLPALVEATMPELNAALEDYGIYLEPNEFNITKQGDVAYHVTAKNNCVIFYGKISITNTDPVQAPQEVYSADDEEVEVEDPTTPPSEGGSGNEPGSGAGNGGVTPPVELTLLASLEGDVIEDVTYQYLNLSFEGVTENSASGVIQVKDSSDNLIVELSNIQLPTTELIEMTFPAGNVTVTFLVEGKQYTAVTTAQAVIPSSIE